MTSSSLAAATAERPRFVRHACLAGLLLAEVLYFTVNYDTQALDRLPSAWARLIGWAPQLLRLSIAVVGVTLLVGATEFRGALQQSPVMNRRWPYFLAGHV
jgi:hypothetical protein